MSKYGPCQFALPTCGPQSVAWWQCQNGNEVRLCKVCLDAWFDNADDDPWLEPADWRWHDAMAALTV